MSTTNLPSMTFNKMSSSKYSSITPVEGQFYVTPDDNVVHTTGNENIAGTKTYTGYAYYKDSGTAIHLNSTNFDTTVTPTSNLCAGIQLNDKNGVRIGKLETCINTSGVFTMSMNAHRKVNDTSKYSAVTCWVSADGTDRCSFPKCTTNATTSSTASNDKVAVITQNYKSGTSWYRVWSDGWIEQGGGWGTNTGGWAEASVTYLKAYKDTNYQLFVQGNWSNAECSSCKVTARSTTGFTGTYANNLYSVMPSWWYACGY